jgi:hypothetical protein
VPTDTPKRNSPDRPSIVDRAIATFGIIASRSALGRPDGGHSLSRTLTNVARLAALGPIDIFTMDIPHFMGS